MLDKSFFANGFVALVIAVLTTLAVTSLFLSPSEVISVATIGVNVTSPLLSVTVNVLASPEIIDFTVFFAEIVTSPLEDERDTLSPAFNVTFPSAVGVITVAVLSPLFLIPNFHTSDIEATPLIVVVSATSCPSPST